MDEFSPCCVINWDPEEKGESSFPETWKNSRDRSAGAGNCSKRANSVEPRCQNSEEEEPVQQAAQLVTGWPDIWPSGSIEGTEDRANGGDDKDRD